MRNGTYAVTLTQGNLTVIRVGYFKRDESDTDEYEVIWSTPYRDGYATLPSNVWYKGPQAAPRWKWGPALPSVVHRFHFQPLARLDDVKAWEPIIGKKPEGW